MEEPEGELAITEELARAGQGEEEVQVVHGKNLMATGRSAHLTALMDPPSMEPRRQ